MKTLRIIIIILLAFKKNQSSSYIKITHYDKEQ